MNIHHLYYFVKLAHLEHYSKAANELCITQPSLSHAMASLEKELGTSLFEKQGRNIVLTKYGRMFLEYVEQSLEILETGIKKTRSMTSTLSGHIDLAFIYTLGTHFVPRIVNQFLKANPNKNIEFTFYSENTSDIIKGLKEEKFDITFCSRRENEKEIEFVPISEQELVVIVPPNHELATKKEIDLKEAAPYPLVAFSKISGLRPVIDGLYKEIGVEPNIAYELEEDGAVAGLVAENFGIAVIPNIPLLKSLNLKILPIINPIYKREIFMAKMKNKFLVPVVHEFSQFVLEKTCYN